MTKLMKDYLIYTFSIMIICWGICMLCTFNNFSLKKVLLPLNNPDIGFSYNERHSSTAQFITEQALGPDRA